MVNGADINLSDWLAPSSLLNSLCFGLFNKLAALSALSSFLSSDKSGIFAPGITENGAFDSN